VATSRSRFFQLAGNLLIAIPFGCLSVRWWWTPMFLSLIWHSCMLLIKLNQISDSYDFSKQVVSINIWRYWKIFKLKTNRWITLPKKWNNLVYLRISNSERYYNFISIEKKSVWIYALLLSQNATYIRMNRRIQPIPIFIGKTRTAIAIGSAVTRRL
jgi:hypothetical protein